MAATAIAFTLGASAMMAEGPEKIKVPGEFSFASEVEYIDDAYASVLESEFEFEIYIDGGQYGTMTVNRFVTPSSGPYAITYYPLYGTFDFRSTSLGRVNGTQLYFRDASSRYDEMIWIFDESGDVTCPDFNIVTSGGKVVAKYTDVVITRLSSPDPGEYGPEENPVFIGSHTIPGWWIADYTKGDGTTYRVTSDNDVTISINDNYQFTSLGGFNVSSFLINENYNIGTIKGNTWSIVLNPFGSVLNINYDTGEGYFVSGSARTGQEAPNLNSELTLVYNPENETFRLSDFSIWYKEIVTEAGETDEDGTTITDETVKWTLCYRYSTREITGGIVPDEEEEEESKGNDSGISEITEETSAPCYFDLRGMKVENPSNGIFILLHDGKAKKIRL